MSIAYTLTLSCRAGADSKLYTGERCFMQVGWWYGSAFVEATFKNNKGQLASQLLYNK